MIFFRRLNTWTEHYGSWIVTAALCVFALALIYWRIVRGYAPPVSYVQWPEPPDWVNSLYAVRWIIRGAQVAAGAVLVYAEWVDQTLSRWLRATLKNRVRSAILLGMVGLLLGNYLLQPGNFASGDANVQRSSSWVVWEAIKDGQWFVYWTNYAYMGSPFSQFHGSIYYPLVALTNLFTNDFYNATEITLLALHILSAYAMYLYVKQLTTSRSAGFAASVCWSATFYRYHLILVLGKLPYALFVGLWPVQFYLIERLIQKADRPQRLWAALALTVGLMLWTHVLYGSWVIALGILYTLIRLFNPIARSNIRENLKLFALIVSAHIYALSIAIYQIIPTLIEATRFNSTRFGLPIIGLENVLIFKDSYLTNWFGGFIGNTIVGLSVLAVVIILATRYSRAFALIGQMTITLFMTFAPRYWPTLFDAIFHALPLGDFAYAAKSPGIYLIVFIGPATALVGVLAHVIAKAVASLRLPSTITSLLSSSAREFLPERIALITAIVVLAEIVPLTLWVNIKYPDTYIDGLPGRHSIMQSLARTEGKSTRVVDVEAGIFGTYAIPMWTGHPGLFGHWEESPASTGTLVHLVKLLMQETPTGQISPETANLLYQLNVGYLITDGTVQRIIGLEEITRTGEAVLWRVSDQTPLIATSRPANGNLVMVNTPQGGDTPVGVISHAFTSTTATLQFSLPRRAFVQAAYSAYPYQKVTLDGAPISVTPTALGLIGFWANAGEHTVVITPELSLLRQWTLAIGGLATLIALAVLLLPNRHQSRMPRDPARAERGTGHTAPKPPNHP